ncbi:OmpH family outer membrane protein [Dinghuibacter silviterrae]|uniref:Periplasmic chaperone for outer membrane proteins Skp n=1 Tax=Dinghuibacter silviterrae TaxID=1539049 RepID=A0A4R8DQ04_9BACT|nr:OmpH family outer membrane protein [Dinghuibacter silviterrae]TDW99968.1 periplasmic chaperone for outer membrane proteins Skp [Dinghuibacter silviterrae]
MKKVLFATLFVMGLSTIVGVKVQAQNKIGYISMDELVSVMPEAKKADTVLSQYRDGLAQAQQQIQQELQTRYQAYIKDSATMSQPKKDLETRGIQELANKLQNYNQDAQQQMSLKQQEVYGPIQKKAMDAITEVAKENGYAYIMTKENLLVSPPTDDILPLVKKKLGIK